MSTEFVWTQTGGNSWSVRRASPPPAIHLTPWWPTPGPYQALAGFQPQNGEEQRAHANANAQALAASGGPVVVGLDAALAGNIWAYLGGMPK